MDSQLSAPPAAASSGRHLWQLPTFLAGIAALVGVWYARPHLRPPATAGTADDTAALRVALDEPDADRLRELRDRVLSLVEESPGREGELLALVGSADLALAEAAPAGAEADRLWESARGYLEDALSRGIVGDDARARHDLAKARERDDAVPPDEVIPSLRDTVGAVKRPAEGYRRLAEAYLRLATPDLPAARTALESAIKAGRPATQTAARLTLGQVLCRLKQAGPARKVLAGLPDDLPADDAVRALLCLAEAHSLDGDAGAAKQALSEAAARAADADPKLRGAVDYRLGVAHAADGDAAKAAAALERARAAGGPAGQAACLRRAELLLKQVPATAALPLLEAGLNSVERPEEYANGLLPLGDARRIVAAAVQKLRFGDHFAEARKAADLYARIGEEGQVDLLRSETDELWARWLLKQAEADPAGRAGLEKLARSKYLAAAVASRRHSDTLSGTRRADALRRAAGLFGRSGKPKAATDILTALVAEPGLSDGQKGGAWAELGELYRLAGRLEDAARALDRAVATARGAELAEARLGRAILYVGHPEGRPKYPEVIAHLRANIDADVIDPVVREESRFWLGRVLFADRRYEEARRALVEALNKHPDGESRHWASHLIGLCYWRQAWEANKAHNRAAAAKDDAEASRLWDDVQDKLGRALLAFRKAESDLLARQRAGRFGDDDLEAYLLREASLKVAECYHHLRQSDAAVEQAEAVAGRYKGQVWELVALEMAYENYRVLNRPADARRVAGRVRAAFAAMPENEFLAEADAQPYQRNRTQAFWRRWLALVGQAAGGEKKGGRPESPRPPIPEIK